MMKVGVGPLLDSMTWHDIEFKKRNNKILEILELWIKFSYDNDKYDELMKRASSNFH